MRMTKTHRKAEKPRMALLQARVRTGLTQKEVAEKCGVTDVTIGNMELGRFSVKLSLAKRLSAVLRVPLEHLFPEE